MPDYQYHVAFFCSTYAKDEKEAAAIARLQVADGSAVMEIERDPNMPPEPNSDDKKAVPGIAKVLTLSTAHVTETTAKKLARYAETDSEMPVAYDLETYGWLVYTGDMSNETTWPDDLRTIVAFARNHSCLWIKLDRDGETVDGLPTYEW